MTNNQGIIHIADRQGGRPWCGKRNAHQSTTVALLHTWGRVCVRCQARLDKFRAQDEARQERQQQKDEALLVTHRARGNYNI